MNVALSDLTLTENARRFGADVTHLLPFDIDKCEPLLVRKTGDKYQVIDGVSRYSMLKLLGYRKVPVRITT